MLKPTDKTALVTHRNCLDGTGTAFIFVLAGGKRENVFFRNIQTCALSAEEAAPFDEVWFVDVCPADLSDPAGGKPWRVFDHHQTNIDRHDGHPNCKFDNNCCGTSLLARECGLDSGAERTLIKAIEGYDLGRFDQPGASHMADLAASYTQSELLDNLLDRVRWPLGCGSDLLWLGHFESRADAVGDVRIIWADQIVRNAWATEFVMPDGSRLWFAIAVAPMIWKNTVAEGLLSKSVMGRTPDVAVVVDYGSNSVSLRSLQDGPDVARIAEMFGGGGHKHASGFKLDKKLAFSALFDGVFE